MTDNFDDAWLGLYPLDHANIDPYRLSGWADAASLAAREQYLRWARSKFGWHHGAPADAFAFGRGEGPSRDGTKIGGLPYWPADRAWPTDDTGEPMVFLAQLNFTQSRDTLSVQVPDDMLVIFVGAEWLEGAFEDRLTGVWLPTGLGDLIDADAMPDDRLPIALWGQRLRTEDFNDVGVIGDLVDAWRTLSPGESRSIADDRNREYAQDFCRQRAFKIGGYPFLLTSDDVVDTERVRQELGGAYIAQITSVWPADGEHPWIDTGGATDLAAFTQMEERLEFRDGFWLQLALADDGSLCHHFQM